ncbi:MAG: LysR family transcriptional regulator [Limnohabitans sp.]|jgi:DNA-binding transcriptional LysR family regulator|nr:LysR family transcriptional regulator [Limnohabitans sp.]MDP4771129.1 LysR family transcriptional regulator [Limnohabitans sp.]
MDLYENFKAFVNAAESNSFSAAARKLDVVPSVIAKRVQDLEKRIQAPLFLRTTRSMELTDVGERYLTEVKSLLIDTENVLNGLSKNRGNLEGHIKIKIPGTLGQLYLSRLLHKFMQIHPHLHFEILQEDRSVNPLEEGFDLALGALPESYGGVQDIPLCALDRHLCASPSYLQLHGTPAQPSDLYTLDTLVYATSGSRWQLLGPQGTVILDLKPKLRTTDGTGLLQATRQGMGIAVIAAYLSDPDLQKGQLIQVLPDYHIPQIWLKALVPERRLQLPRIRELIEFLQHQLAAGLKPMEQA